MQTCDEILELISASLDGELTEEERLELDTHLDVCPACRALFVELAGLQEAAWEPEQAPAGFAHQVMEQIAANPIQDQPPVAAFSVNKRHSPWKRWMACAAVVAVVVLAAVTLPHQLHKAPSSTDFAENAGTGFEVESKESITENSSIQDLDDGKFQPNGRISSESDDIDMQFAPNEEATMGMYADADSVIFNSLSPDGEVYCGVLVLTNELLPEGLEDYSFVEGEEGYRSYVVPASYFFVCSDALELQNDSSDILASPIDTENTIDPDAEYGLIIVK